VQEKLCSVKQIKGKKVDSVQEYIINNHLNNFRHVFVVIAGSLREEDVLFTKVAKATLQTNQFSFIRTKCDADLSSIADEKRTEINKTIKLDYRQRGCQFMLKELGRHAPEAIATPCYFVSEKSLLEVYRHKDVHENSDYRLDESRLLLAIFGSESTTV